MPYTEDEVLISELMSQVLISELMSQANASEKRAVKLERELLAARAEYEPIHDKLIDARKELSRCMEQRDRVLSQLRRTVNQISEGYTADAEKLLDESRDWK